MAEVVIGPDEDWPVGVVHVRIAPGGGMAAHAHGASATSLVPLMGTVRIVEDDSGAVTDVAEGTMATIPVGERVRLENTGEGEARLLVVLSPPDFAGQVNSWPTVDA
ncbi:MAG: cupin domain-containing protein [Acidimicrobiales bacterium]